MALVLLILAAVSLLIWVYLWCAPCRPYAPLDDAQAPGACLGNLGDDPPLVSIVIPARNEEATIGEALRAHAACTYPRREIILVDDHSEDRTREAAAAALEGAACPARVIEAAPLPEGWVGKVNAMAQGVEAAGGAYVLFTDADIVLAPELLGELVAESEAGGLGLNSRMALLAALSFWERMLVPAFVYFFALLYPFRAVCDPRRRTAAAAGGCMLVRRAALERAGGLAVLRNAIIDDVALARAVKSAGFPLRLTLTRKARSLRRYTTLGGFWHTVTRTAFTQLRYSWLGLALATCALLAAYAVPVAAALAGALCGDAPAALMGAAAWALCAGLFLPTARYYGVAAAYAAALPVTAMLYLAMTWHSAFRYARGGRSVWKGRRYERRGAPSHSVPQ